MFSRKLLFYASYPASDIRQPVGQMAILSISGSKDGLAKPAKVEKAKGLLPASTEYMVIQGGIHSYFGEYVLQSGDGQARISGWQAREQIRDDTLAFLER